MNEDLNSEICIQEPMRSLDNQKKSYDVIIPVDKKNSKFVKNVVKYIRLNLPEANCIYLIANESLFKCLGGGVDNRCILIDENKMIPELNFSDVHHYLLNNGMLNINTVGWYFQQFLKFGFAFTSYCKEYYLSWDADTLPLSHIHFFENNKPLFTLKKEYHPPYFETLHRLIGLGKAAKYSFVAEHMMFNQKIVHELIEEIKQSKVKGDNWVEKCINACDFNSTSGHFSEFETYGTYCLVYYPEFYGTQFLNTFRSAALIRGRYINDFIIERLAMDVDIASFEIYDAIFPYDFEKRKYLLARKIRRLCSSSFKDNVKLICENISRKMRK